MINPFINSHHRLRSGWWIVIFFVVLAALLLPLLLVSRSEGASPPIWQQALVVIIASLICQALRRRPLAEVIGKLDLTWLKRVVLGAGLGAVLMLAPATLLWATGQVHLSLNPGGANLLLPSLALFAAVAVTEEVLFRGFIFQRLLDGLGEWPAQVLIAALFLLTHVDAIQNAGLIGYLAGVNIFVASFMFGLAFIRTKSLAMPIGIHLAANFVQGGVLGFGVSGSEEQGLFAPALSGSDWLTGGAFGLEASVPGLISVITLTAALYMWRPATK
ncbi:CPBP family intramembrane glutamic endopeptidase [Candidatus Viadribacter manganicus]|uniref:CAAX prenyl protease 2/Lysostaphin resistance protein A-like domain-containing protein n=1 Tax=Candidatus Viadribacter manganicus TaxID=1759059 RepID=A0A1B1AH58_9PROT|nr:CPBP family intramembrane glutamic endopeptidase [Candidatus Viadribacter manganicus]ANP45870.1 hypothetical protein ATE48_08020 [Candidatus Viadribacter manganicus]